MLAERRASRRSTLIPLPNEAGFCESRMRARWSVVMVHETYHPKTGRPLVVTLGDVDAHRAKPRHMEGVREGFSRPSMLWKRRQTRIYGS